VSEAAPDLDRTLAALADTRRRRAVELLKQGPLSSGQLAAALGLPPPAMSKHLAVLRKSGLVEESHPEFDARVRIYSLRPQPMAGLLAWLRDAEGMWSEQLAAFKEHIEAG
jgi:DNA-binding transcriptional ArsR family regulator